MKILSSASRIVFILMAFALVGGMFLKIIDPKDFLILAGTVFAYFYTNKSGTPTDTLGGK